METWRPRDSDGGIYSFKETRKHIIRNGFTDVSGENVLGTHVSNSISETMFTADESCTKEVKEEA